MKYLKNKSNFNKKYFLVENKQQSEAILSKLGIGLDNSDYKEIKKMVSGNINYLGLFTKFFFNQNASLTDLDKIITFLKSDDAKKLNKNPLQYEFEELSDEIIDIQNDNKVMDFYRELTSDQKEFVNLDNEDFRVLAEQFYDISNKEGFFKNISKIKSFGILMDSMEEYIEKYKKYGNYDLVLKTLKSNPNLYSVILNDSENKILIAKIRDYEGSKLIGSDNWCIVNSISHWSNYTSNSPRNQYFVWNFSLDPTDPNYYTAYTIGMSDNITSAFDFNNKDIKSKLPRHVKDNQSLLKGPDESDLDEIQLRKFKEEEERKREERERAARILRQKQERAAEHREEELFSSLEEARAFIEYATDNQIIDLEELEESEDEDIYDVVFYENYTHYYMKVFSVGNTSYAVGDYDDMMDACREYLEGFIKEHGYIFNNIDISDYLDIESITDHLMEGEEDYWRDNWRDYSIDGELTSKAMKKVHEIVKFINESSTSDEIKEETNDLIKDHKEGDKDDEELLDELESILDNMEDTFNTEDDDEKEELEEKRQELYDLCGEIKDKDDDDYWEVSESSLEKYVSERRDEISNDPKDYLENMGYDEKSITETLSRYVDDEKLIDDVIDMDGFGHTIGSYGTHDEVSVDDKTYYIIRID